MEKKKINVWPLDLLSGSVQDLFDAPAAQEEIEALLNRLDKAVGEISTQEVLAPSKTHSHVPKVLSQSGGGHGLGKRTLRMHGSEWGTTSRDDEEGSLWGRNGRRVWPDWAPAAARGLLCVLAGSWLLYL